MPKDKEQGVERVVCWFSCGAASAVAARLATWFYADLRPVVIAYCETNAEHPDNERFLADCERWIGAKVQRLSSTEYLDTWHVWEERRYIEGEQGCRAVEADELRQFADALEVAAKLRPLPSPPEQP